MKKLALIPLIGILGISGCLTDEDSKKVKTWSQPERTIGQSWTYHLKEGDFDFQEIKTTIHAVNVDESGTLIGKDSSIIYKKNDASYHEGNLVTDSVVVNSAQAGTFRMDNMARLKMTSTGSIYYYTPLSAEGILTETSEEETCTKETDLMYPIKVGDTWTEEDDCSFSRIAGTNEISDSKQRNWSVTATGLDTLTVKEIDFQVIVVEKVLDVDTLTREIHYLSKDLQNMILIEKIKADTLESYLELVDYSL